MRPVLREARRNWGPLRARLMRPRQAGEIPESTTGTEAPEVLLERQFLDAWLQADSRTLKALEAPGCIRIWHNGSLTQGLEGRAPEHVEASNFQVIPVKKLREDNSVLNDSAAIAGSGEQTSLPNHTSSDTVSHATPSATWVVTYVLTWTGAKVVPGLWGKRGLGSSCTSPHQSGSAAFQLNETKVEVISHHTHKENSRTFCH